MTRWCWTINAGPLTSATNEVPSLKPATDAPAAGDLGPAVVVPRAPVRRSLPARLRAWLLPSVFGLLVLLFGLIAIGPLLQPGYFWGAHDARHDVYFLFQYDKSVQEGNWFPRWGPDWAFGYGYPFWIIYAPLGVLLGELCHHFLGLGLGNERQDRPRSLDRPFGARHVRVRALVARAPGRAGGRTGLHGRPVPPGGRLRTGRAARIAGPGPAAPGALGFPCHSRAPTAYERPGGSLAYAALWWTHNLTALIFTPGLMVYVLALAWWETKPAANRNEQTNRYCRRRNQPQNSQPPAGQARRPGCNGRRPCARLSCACCRRWRRACWPSASAQRSSSRLCSRPATSTRRSGSASTTTRSSISCISSSSSIRPGVMASACPGPDDVSQGALSYQLGAVPALLALITLFTARRLGRARRELWLFGFFACAAVFLTLNISAPAWHLPLVPYAQFPWRYLLVAIPFLSLLAGAIVADAPADARRMPRGCAGSRGGRPGGSRLAGSRSGRRAAARQLPVPAGANAASRPSSRGRSPIPP